MQASKGGKQPIVLSRYDVFGSQQWPACRHDPKGPVWDFSKADENALDSDVVGYIMLWIY